MAGAILIVVWGLYEMHSNRSNFSFGAVYAGLGAYLFWRNWQRSQNPPEKLQDFKYSDLLFWVAILLAGALLWFAVKAR
jgi:hypothetical protein